MLGRILGEVAQAVVAAEVNRIQLGRIDVLAAHRAFLVERHLLDLFLLFLLRLDLGEFEAKVYVDIRQCLLQLGRTLLGDAALPAVDLAQELHVLEAGQAGVGDLRVVEVNRHEVGQPLDVLQRGIVHRRASEAELGQPLAVFDRGQAGAGDLRVGQVQFAQVGDVRQRGDVLVLHVFADQPEVRINQLRILRQSHHQRGGSLIADAFARAELGNGGLLGVGHLSCLDVGNRQAARSGLGLGAFPLAEKHEAFRPLGSLIDPCLDPVDLFLAQRIALGRHDVLMVSREDDPFEQFALAGFAGFDHGGSSLQ